MRKNLTALALLLALAAPLTAQQQGLWPPSLTLDAAPPGTAVIPLWYPDQTRAKKTTFSILRAGLFDLTTTGAGNLVWATPNGTTGVFSARALVAADIPTLSYVTTLSMPADFSVSGTTALTVSRISQAANLFNASPSGSSGAPTYRAITAADIAAALLPPAKMVFSTTSRLLGANGSGTGGVEITLGTNLSLSGSTLNAAGGGTVTAVSGPTQLTWATSTTTPTATWNSQAQGLVFASPPGSSGVPTFQALAAGHMPAFTGAVTTSAGSTTTAFASGQTIPTPTLTTPVLNTPTIGTAASAGTSHATFRGSTPTASCSGTGTGASASVAGVDAVFVVSITTGTSATTTGTCTFTFSSSSWTTGNAPACIAALTSGTQTWPSSATIIEAVESTSAPQFTWTTNGGALVSSSAGSYKITVMCFGK